MAKVSPAASAFAPFCTPEEVNALMYNAQFSVARRLRSAFDNKLYILPPRGVVSTSAAPLFMGAAEGIPVFELRPSGAKFVIGRVFNTDFNGSQELETTSAAYLVSRSKKMWSGFAQAKTNIEERHKQTVFLLMRDWLKEMISLNDVAVGDVVTIPPDVQHQLIKYYHGAVDKDSFTPAMQALLNSTHEKLLRSNEFMHNTLSHAEAMFGREKWLIHDMGNYIIAAGIDTSPLCQLAQNAVSRKINPEMLNYAGHANKFALRYTHPPTVYRSIEDIEAKGARSILSSLVYVRSTMQGTELAGADASATVLGLPDAKAWRFHIDAGWFFSSTQGADRAKLYGQFLFMDKD